MATDTTASELPAAERRSRLEARHPRWEPGTLAGLLDRGAAEFGDRPLIVTDERTYTYAEVREWSRRLAAGLLDLGVEPGQQVAMTMANFPEFAAVKFAISRVGACAVPVNFLFRAGELGYVLDQSDSVALITMDRFRDLDYLATLDEIAPGWERDGGGAAIPKLRNVVVFGTDGAYRGDALTLERLGEADAEAASVRLGEIAAAADPEGYADILYTSGTTGSPKGVLITNEMVLRTAYGSAYNRALADGHRILFALPMYHVFGYVECLLAAMYAGGAIVPRTAFDPDEMLAAIARHRTDEIVCVPLMTLALLKAARAGDYDLDPLRVVFSSGGVQPASIWKEIREVLDPVEMTTGYGMTETTAATTCTLPEGDDRFLSTTNGKLREAGVAGDPELGGYLAIYKTVDPETGADLEFGERGELLVRGPMVTPGYYRKPEETEAAFAADGWLRTGDIGTIDADGYLCLTGRLKESYRCGGEMVMPKEVEALLDTADGVNQAHVVGIPDPKMGEVGCACVVREEGAGPDPEALIALCRERLARFKVPRHVIFIEADELPLTATGRVQKFRLVELAQERLRKTAGNAKGDAR